MELFKRLFEEHQEREKGIVSEKLYGRVRNSRVEGVVGKLGIDGVNGKGKQNENGEYLVDVCAEWG